MSDAYRMIVRAPGGPEAIERVPLDALRPADDAVMIRTTAIGVNFIDIYHRTGLYPMDPPIGLGLEAAGVVERAGATSGFAEGDRVAVMIPKPGTYATHVVAPAHSTVRLPPTIADETAAAALLKGLTAWMLAEPCGNVRPGQTTLILAAAGGVGSLLVQWLTASGVIVIAHAGSPEKAQRAAGFGAQHILASPFDTLATDVRRLTEGRGVDVVFDGVGAASWQASLASAARRGLIVSYGNASGPVPPTTPLEIGRAGSLFLTRPTLFDYVAERGALQAAAARLFAMIEAGRLTVEIGQRLPLAEAAEMHHILEARKTTGSSILLP